MTLFWCYIVGSYLGNYLMMRRGVGQYDPANTKDFEEMARMRVASIIWSPVTFAFNVIFFVLVWTIASTCPKEEE